MKRIVFSLVFTLVIALDSCNFRDMNEFSNAAPSSEKKSISKQNKKFMYTFLQKTMKVNDEILSERIKIENLKLKPFIQNPEDIKWLNQVAARYKMGGNFFNLSLSQNEIIRNIDSLLIRVDVVPEKLILAQAIIESGWGTCNMAKEANNFFGILCWSPGCGIVSPNVHDHTYMLKSYASIEAGVSDYLRNINTHRAYEAFRIARAAYRKNDQALDSKELAATLSSYSTRGSYYTNTLSMMIEKYIPDDIHFFLKTYHKKG